MLLKVVPQMVERVEWYIGRHRAPPLYALEVFSPPNSYPKSLVLLPNEPGYQKIICIVYILSHLVLISSGLF